VRDAGAASSVTSSVLRSCIRPMSARIAATSSAKRSAVIILPSHARTSSRSGANAEVTLSREAIAVGSTKGKNAKFPHATIFYAGSAAGWASRALPERKRRANYRSAKPRQPRRHRPARPSLLRRRVDDATIVDL
jgi:hypothetical protein